MKKFPEYKIGKLTFIDKREMSRDQWVNERFKGVGGSDMSSILDLNPFANITQLFFEKIGYREPEDLSRNEAVFWGEMDEENILTVAQHYDFEDPLAYMQNYRDGIMIRNVIPMNWMIRHDDIPWLIINIDGVQCDYGAEEFDEAIEKGTLLPIEVIHEAKNISSYTADMWEQGIPVGYVAQDMSYMIPFKELFPDISGCIWSKEDGKKFTGHPIPWNDTVVEKVLTKGAAFWEDVQSGRYILEEAETVSEADHKLENMAPRPDSITPQYEKFLNKRLQEREAKTIAGPEEILAKAKEYQELKAEEKSWAEKASILSTEIKEFMAKNDALVLDYGKEGKISFNKRIYINIK